MPPYNQQSKISALQSLMLFSRYQPCLLLKKLYMLLFYNYRQYKSSENIVLPKICLQKLIFPARTTKKEAIFDFFFTNYLFSSSSFCSDNIAFSNAFLFAPFTFLAKDSQYCAFLLSITIFCNALMSACSTFFANW